MHALIAVFNVVACVVGLLLLIPSTVLVVQVLSARTRTHAAATPGRRPRLAILVPAHNEGEGLAPALKALRQQLESGDRLVVVADNCSDDTADVAARGGAEVVVREDTTRRGKGYALDRGLQHLSADDPPEVVVFVDADCLVREGAVDALARACAASGRPEQALYLMHAPEGAGLKLRIAEFAWVVKNQVRPLGYHRWGLPCQITGSGMALPWVLLQNVSLATGSIVEDMQLGLDLAQTGTPPRFCVDALVTSSFPTQAAGIQSQRTRWEHGHLELAIARGLPLLWQGVRKGRLDVAAMALDLCIPPLASLVAALVAAMVLTLAFGVLTQHWLASTMVAAALCLVAIAVLLARARFASHIISLGELASVPTYVLGKIPTYLSFARRRQTEWVRTDRDRKPSD